MADIAPLLYFRIVQVDLKFPPKPIVSSAAKDLISQVLFFCALLLNVILTSQVRKNRVTLLCSFCPLITDACQGFIRPLAPSQASRTSLDCSEC